MRVWRSVGRSALDAAALATSAEAREFLRAALLREFSYAHGLTKSLGPPQIYNLETTNHCPYKCIMCPRTYDMTRSLGDMDLGLFKDIVDQLRPAWQKASVRAPPTIRLLHFGEPMVYRHFKESVDYCHERGFQVYISTNPSVWTEQRIEEILDSQLDDLWVMFDGMDDATSMAIRGPAASFVRGEKNLRELARRKAERGLNKPRIMVQMIRQPKNQHQWDLFRNHWRDMPGIDGAYLDYFSTFSGSTESINEIAADLAAHDRDQAAEQARWQYLAEFPCMYPWHSVSVTWEGRVVPCCRDVNEAVVLGDLRKDSLEKIWNDAPIQSLRREFATRDVNTPLCASCTENSLEIGLPTHYPATAIIKLKDAVGAGAAARAH
jgi:radical SAM protein with 4Fe4S-binding SPASM domain